MTEESASVTVSAIFEQAGDVMSGMLKLAGDFFTGLWAVPMGKITIVLGIVGAAIGLCYRLFLRKKHV